MAPRHPETVSDGGEGSGDPRTGKEAGRGLAHGASVYPPVRRDPR